MRKPEAKLRSKHKGAKPPGGGPDPKQIDFRALDALLSMQGTAEECAAVLGVSVETMDQRVREKFGVTFSGYSKEKRAAGRMSLRRAQYVTATQKQNPAMQIWLGKNWLGQTDKQEITGPGGGPVQAQVSAAPNYALLSTEELDTLKALMRKAARKEALA